MFLRRAESSTITIFIPRLPVVMMDDAQYDDGPHVEKKLYPPARVREAHGQEAVFPDPFLTPRGGSFSSGRGTLSMPAMPEACTAMTDVSTSPPSDFLLCEGTARRLRSPG